MRRALGVVLAVVSFGIGVDVARAEPTSRLGAGHQEDENGDGVVSLEEARAAALRSFDRFDTDCDGVIDRLEAQATARAPSPARLEARFAELDRNRDGRLSPWESRLGPRRFARADTDHDGRLSLPELARATRRRPGAGQQAALAALLWRRDLDRDGRVTRAEMLRAAEQRFRRLDRDADGVLTPRDRRAPAGSERGKCPRP